MNIREEVSKIICAKCNIASIKDDDDLISLGLDSLDIVEAMLEIEDALGVEFDSNEIADLKTFKQVVELIEKKKQ